MRGYLREENKCYTIETLESIYGHEAPTNKGEIDYEQKTGSVNDPGWLWSE